MNYSNAINTPGLNNDYYPMTYVHPNGERTEFDLQQVRYDDGRVPSFVVSESPYNQGPGFDDNATRYAASNQAAESAMILNKPDLFPEAEREIRPNEIELYQQMPDGNFERVSYREIGQDGRPNTNVEMQQNDPELYASLKHEGQLDSKLGEEVSLPAFTEMGRSFYTREDVEDAVEEPLRAAPETLQQQQESLKEQWRDLSGPSIDRPAEVLADQRSQEQSQQMNEHREQHTQSHEF